MPLNPQVKMILDAQNAMNFPPLNTLPVEVVRQGAIAQTLMEGGIPTPVANIVNRTIPGPAGEIPMRIYTPEGTGPFPILVFFHGGGFVICNLDTHDGTCRDLCAGAGCIVVSVDYRLAPDYKFPAAPDDCFAATKWVAAHTTELNGDANRIAVGGDSAGGNLAAVSALRCKLENGPKLCGQLLIYPVTNMHEQTTPSVIENATGYFLTRDDMIWFGSHYLNRYEDADNIYASPSVAPDLSGLPPTLILTAEFDPLRDDGEAYARRLKEFGVSTTLRRYDGLIHGFFGMNKAVEQAQGAVNETCVWLKDLFKR